MAEVLGLDGKPAVVAESDTSPKLVEIAEHVLSMLRSEKYTGIGVFVVDAHGVPWTHFYLHGDVTGAVVGVAAATLLQHRVVDEYEKTRK